MTHLEEYNRIIEFRKANPLPEDQYGENHHIKPRSIYPELENDKDNIVKLTAAEHFLCHYHIWKYYKEELKDKTKSRKMMYAFLLMKRVLLKCDDIEAMSKMYEEVKVALSQRMKQKMKGKSLSNEIKMKISKTLKGRPCGMLGKHHSADARKRISEACCGKTLSEETRKRISEAQCGEKNHNFGKPAWNKGKQTSNKTKQKLSDTIKQLHWFNNGTKNIRAKECPDGFVQGRLPRKAVRT